MHRTFRPRHRRLRLLDLRQMRRAMPRICPQPLILLPPQLLMLTLGYQLILLMLQQRHLIALIILSLAHTFSQP